MKVGISLNNYTNFVKLTFKYANNNATLRSPSFGGI